MVTKSSRGIMEKESRERNFIYGKLTKNKIIIMGF